MLYTALVTLASGDWVGAKAFRGLVRPGFSHQMAPAYFSLVGLKHDYTAGRGGSCGDGVSTRRSGHHLTGRGPPGETEDAQSSGQICYEAFRTLNDRHAFPPDFPAPSVAIDVVSMMFSHPRFYCVAAEFEGQLVGSNCLDERGPIAGIGPITVDPTVQDRGVGRSLM